MLVFEEVHSTLFGETFGGAYNLTSMCLFLLQFPSSLSSVLSLFDFDPEEIARQLTIIDFRLFAKIKPAELLNQVRSSFQHSMEEALTVLCDSEEVFQQKLCFIVQETYI